MRIAQVFAHAMARRIAYVLVAALLAWCGIGRADAACKSGEPMCTRPQAWAACEAGKAADGQAWCNIASAGSTSISQSCGELSNPSRVVAYTACRAPAGHNTVAPGGGPTQMYFHNGSTTCASGSTWNEAFKKCISPSECLARNADLGAGTTTRNFHNRCIAGCTLKLSGPSVGVDGLFSGVFQYSGDTCEPGPTNPLGTDDDATRRPPQECTPAGGGMTFCLKSDGQHCYTSSNGRQTCWRPGETGEKDDGPVKQKRDAGTEARPPNVNLPNGDQLQQTGSPKTQTTTVTTNNGSASITTTTTNYTTVNGTNAGPKNEGESNTGDGSGKEGDGDSENGVSGGSCTAGYTTTGDPLLGAILQEEHKQRCAQDKLKSDMQADIAAGDGDNGAGSIWDTAGTPLAFNEGLVSLGGGGIPDLSFNVDGQSFAPFAGPTSDFIATLRWLIIAAATIAGLYIIWNR